MSNSTNLEIISDRIKSRILQISATIGCSVLILDWVIKATIVNHYAPFELILQSPFISLIYVTNTGAVCGYAQGANSILAVIGTITTALIVYSILFLIPSSIPYAVAFGLLLAGSLGNLLDRLRYGFVVDYISVEILHWPSFNLADAAIIVGISIVGLLTLREYWQERGSTAPMAVARWKWGTWLLIVLAGLLVAAAYVLCIFHPFD